MIEELKKIIPEKRIRSRYIDLVSYASDAGFYYMLPKAVVQPVSEEEIIALFRFSHQRKIPLVFRTGGTSLSGQSITDGILVDLSKCWHEIRVEQKGDCVRVQPGITGAMVNAHLKKFNRKIGPDPSSISAAMMGGILSNNASGMCCGVSMNSYHTTKHIRFILPNGMAYTTEKKDDYERFERECTILFQELRHIRTTIVESSHLLLKIRDKYKTKTTVGYSLNAFVDFKHPLDILAHLLIGAEGTLAFIAEAVMETVPDHPFKSTALLYFPTITAACEAIIPLSEAGAMMVELMDRASLRAVERLPGMPEMVRTLPDGAAALLIEFQEAELELLQRRIEQFLLHALQLQLINAPAFTEDPKEQAFLWKVRKGLFPAVGAVRASGTTVILEDIAFPVEELGNAILDLQDLFQQYHYDNAIIFGHAKDGNIHFVVTQSFNTTQEVDRYDCFIRDVVKMVVEKYNGTLKAEHGTGRNMAPFVETEWGAEAYEIIKRIKNAIDPEGLLNPGVIVNKDENAHVQHLKKLPTIEDEVDRCIECGYCEPVCPSHDLTTSPRRRIVVRRQLELLKAAGDKKNHQLLVDQYQYEGLDTCAVDGLCAGACPVDINTGDLVKRLRRENHSHNANRLALFTAKYFRTTTAILRAVLFVGVGLNRLRGKNVLTGITKTLSTWLPGFPIWSAQLTTPPSQKILKEKRNPDQASIVYYPSCISRVMGNYTGKEKNIMETFLSICEKTGIKVAIPENVNSSCCSQIFSSKGYTRAQQQMANSTLELLWDISDKGKTPVVTDVSSCAFTLQQLRPSLYENNKEKFDKLIILDTVDFIHDFVIPKASVKNKKKQVMLHPVCSLQKMKTEEKFSQIAAHFSEEVTVPLNAGCCGMAGDRGFLFPELTASATLKEATEVQTHTCDGYYSTTKTCEMAMSEATARNYESILFLVDESI